MEIIKPNLEVGYIPARIARVKEKKKERKKSPLTKLAPNEVTNEKKVSVVLGGPRCGIA